MESSSTRRALPSTAVSLLVLAGLALTGCASAGPAASPSTAAPVSGAASPSAVPTTQAPSNAKSPTAAAVPGDTVPSPAAPAPLSVSIPAIGVESPLVKLGLRPNRSLEVPADGPGAPAGWYSGSPSPGETGPAVLLGHVNATGGGPGVFADLRRLATGAQIKVTRTDGSMATFAVYRAAAYRKNSFPTFEVYGNTRGSELRLITCDGYDPATGEFDDNYVVYAKLTGPVTAKIR
ncbi:sortase (surface protein transpeptidase) [Arthrobacter pascens]|uniref:sortase domain-containing protein n=1 Tax=Arthrobacter pascens TaxID=1677 RepID=UPI002854B370|nr:sortase [Arthrobacter pascens]MDR6555769.1 sortase (surface protein transpeptidase) [Arthrobacter pascens]